jgi:hypothetical protein
LHYQLTNKEHIMANIRILSIDSWRNTEGGWDWNAWYKVGECDSSISELPVRKLLRYMRESGFLSAGSAGSVAIDDDGYNVVIVARGTREPIFALEYGASL